MKRIISILIMSHNIFVLNFWSIVDKKVLPVSGATWTRSSQTSSFYGSRLPETGKRRTQLRLSVRSFSFGRAGARPSHAHERCGNERERQPPTIDARARIGVRFHTGENQSDLLPHL